MKLPKELTTVTPLSKYLALSLFIILPIFAFFFGMRYSQLYYSEILSNSLNSFTKPSVSMKNINGHISYENRNFDYSVLIPPNLEAKTIDGKKAGDQDKYVLLRPKIEEGPALTDFYINVLPLADNIGLFEQLSESINGEEILAMLPGTTRDFTSKNSYIKTTVKRTNDVFIHGKEALAYTSTNFFMQENKESNYTNEFYVILNENSDKSYLIGGYYASIEGKRSFQKILSTFKFLN